MRLLMVGGDRRALLLEPLLKQEGYEVHTLGLHTGDEEKMDIAWADALLFPYPFAVKNGCVPALSGITLYAQDVLDAAKENVLIIAGRGLEACKPVNILFYESVKALSQRNAALSAEAAVCEAMQRTDQALPDMKVLVTGYGLFGRALAQRLLALGADVWIAARSREQRLLAAGDGMHPVELTALSAAASKADMLLNTIPAQVIGPEVLGAMRPGSWLLEMASAPYGFDRQEAQRLRLNCDVLPALPARYAPLSAARALKEAVIYLLAEGRA